MATLRTIIFGLAALLLTMNAVVAANLSEQEQRELVGAHSALQQGRFEYALELLEPLYESHPQHPEITNNFAVALFNSGRTTEAGLVLQNFLQTHNDVGVPSKNLFQVYDFVAAESYSLLGGGEPEIPQLEAIAPLAPRVEINSATPQMAVLMTTTEETSESSSEIEKRLKSYANAWSNGDLDAYLSFYYPGRSPIRGQGYSGWKEERSAKISPERNISVVVNDLQVMPIDESQAIAVYRQSYSARNYSDETTKQLTWVKSEGQWYIRYEMALPN